jgi:hypothetical protein
MKTRYAGAAATALALVLAAGCQQQPVRETRGGWFGENHAWEVKKPSDQGATPRQKPRTPSEPVEMKRDSEIVSPIFNARGKWTIRLAFFHDDRKTGHSALHYANDFARTLRTKGHDAFVTDLRSMAIVSMGQFNDERDPQLISTWRQAYEDWMRIHGGRESQFRLQMQEFYGGKTVFGDQPWPVSIIDLQMKMKSAYKIQPTEEEKRLYKEYLDRQQARMRGFDRIENP